MPLRYRLNLKLEKLLGHVRGPSHFVDELPPRWRSRVNARHLYKLLDGSWDSMSRDELVLFFNMFKRLFNEPFIELVDHELWTPFFVDPPIGFVDVHFEERLESSLADRRVLQMFSDGTNPLAVDLPTDNSEHVPRDIRSRNCIFVGGPKQNRYTEVVLCSLLDCTPFKPNTKKLESLPFVFHLGPSAIKGPHSVFVTRDQFRKRGLEVRTKGMSYLLAISDVSKTALRGRDAGICVVARFSGSGKTVTSLILAGATSESTRAMAEALLVDRLPSDILTVKPNSYNVFVHDLRWERKSDADLPRITHSGWVEGDRALSEAAKYEVLDVPQRERLRTDEDRERSKSSATKGRRPRFRNPG